MQQRFLSPQSAWDSLHEKFSNHRIGRSIFTVRNVFPVESGGFKRQALKARPKHSLRVLYAGTLGRAQDLSNAIFAAQLASEQGVKIELKFIGIGAAKAALIAQAKRLGVDAQFVSRKSSDRLDDYYQWADTALVHLADWEPLTRTVPSKTYELMTLGIFITGVVKGETAELIERLGAGAVVPPKQPEALAALWTDLANRRTLIQVDRKGREWVLKERSEVVPHTLAKALDFEAKKSPSE